MVLDSAMTRLLQKRPTSASFPQCLRAVTHRSAILTNRVEAAVIGVLQLGVTNLLAAFISPLATQQNEKSSPA